MNKKPIRVSIICNVYNHAPFIRSALDGFVNQKTNFGFEVLVHDDASTDDSAKIIREYEEKYPEIIKPIFQTENQYSKKIRIGETYQFPRANGDYIALCEGDDYWIDEYKLQKQFDYMEEHPECSLCFSNAYCEQNGERTKQVIPWTSSSKIKENGIYDFQSIEELGYIPTASFFYRLSSRNNFPIIDDRAFRGDGYLKLALTLEGYAYCFPECTCVYRFGVPGSVTTRWKNNNATFRKYADAYILMYQEFNRITDRKYEDILSKRILEWGFQANSNVNNYKQLRDKKYRIFSRKRGIKFLMKYYLICYFPKLYELIKKMK